MGQKSLRALININSKMLITNYTYKVCGYIRHLIGFICLMMVGRTLPSHQRILPNETLSTIPAPSSQMLSWKKETGRFPEDDGTSFRIAFGSCYGLVNFYQDIFKSVNTYQPHVWIWLGDAAYTDDIMGTCTPYFFVKGLTD